MRNVLNSTLRRFWERDSGASAAEFALVVMPMVIMFLVILQFGSMLFVYNDMMNASREAARRMVVNETITFVEGQSITCTDTVNGPATGSVAEVACSSLTSWGLPFVVTTSSSPLGATGYSSMTVNIAVDMGLAGLVDILNVATGRNMRAEATLRSEFPYPPAT